MADPALTQVATALATALAGLTGVNIFTNRSDDNPVDQTEMPAIVIRQVEADLSESAEAGFTALDHIATWNLDFYEAMPTDDQMSFQHNSRIADAFALIAADWQLGGTVYLLTPKSVTGNADAVPDSGVAILTLETRTRTKFDDWTTIV